MKCYLICLKRFFLISFLVLLCVFTSCTKMSEASNNFVPVEDELPFLNITAEDGEYVYYVGSTTYNIIRKDKETNQCTLLSPDVKITSANIAYLFTVESDILWLENTEHPEHKNDSPVTWLYGISLDTGELISRVATDCFEIDDHNLWIHDGWLYRIQRTSILFGDDIPPGMVESAYLGDLCRVPLSIICSSDDWQMIWTDESVQSMATQVIYNPLYMPMVFFWETDGLLMIYHDSVGLDNNERYYPYP